MISLPMISKAKGCLEKLQGAQLGVGQRASTRSCLPAPEARPAACAVAALFKNLKARAYSSV